MFCCLRKYFKYYVITILTISTIWLFDFRNVPTVWYFRNVPKVWYFKNVPTVWYFRNVPTVWYFRNVPTVWYFRNVPTVWYFRNVPTVWYFRNVPTVWYFLFVVLFVLYQHIWLMKFLIYLKLHLLLILFMNIILGYYNKIYRGEYTFYRILNKIHIFFFQSVFLVF
jgi:hypothetical protein